MSHFFLGVFACMTYFNEEFLTNNYSESPNRLF